MAIKYLANLIEEPYAISPGSFDEFEEFIKDQEWYQFDVETNVTQSVVTRVLRTVQFGEFDPSRDEDNKDQWLLEWDLLSPQQQQYILKEVVGDPKRIKVGHNLSFEAQMMRSHGIWMNNIRDTMIREKLIYSGMSKILDEEGSKFFSLESVTRRRLDKELSKEFQTKFGHEFGLTVGHIIYGCQDVGDLDIIYSQQELKLNEYYNVPVEQRTVYNHLPTLEDEVVLSFADVCYNGMELDAEAWCALESKVEPIIEERNDALKKIIIEDEILFNKAIEVGAYFREDGVEINFNSPQAKRDLFLYAFPDLPGATKQNLKGWLKQEIQEGRGNTVQFKVINELHEGNYKPFEDLLVEHCRDYLIKQEYLIPAGTLRVNWNSSDQVIAILSAVSPKMDSTSKETLENLEHPIGYSIIDYRQSLKLKSTYGSEFLKHMDPDNKVRTSINQVLETGRISSSSPNMQQIPGYEAVGTAYRNCFVAPKGSQYVSGDYSSQELVIIAEISQDPVWLDALRKGYDLHSVTSALVYKKTWDDAAEEGCVYVTHKQKCKCRGHKRLRTGIKAINFGLAYGMSKYKLASDMRISVDEAEAIINEYFKTFPKIGAKLTQLGWYGVTKGHIMTLAPYFRKRFFPTWQTAAKYAGAHIQGIRYNPILGTIERASKNTPKLVGSYYREVIQ